MNILGIETSCDDTAVAIVNEKRELIFNKVISGLDEHIQFGGVVPEIASRNHLLLLPQLLREIPISWNEIDAIAVTYGPGLIGGVLVGVMMAKSIAYARNLPIIPINHLEGHLLTNRLVYKELHFPFLTLLVSGGHCQFILAKSLGDYKILGRTRDDAVGEAFDKVARMLGFSYPGGPKIEQLAKAGNSKEFSFPKPLLHEKNGDMSFSGLKSAIKRLVDSMDEQTLAANKANIAASFQQVVTDILVAKMRLMIEQTLSAESSKPVGVAICGGVAANQYICSALKLVVEEMGLPFFMAPIDLCMDNAAMIAWAGVERLQTNTQEKAFQNFTFAPQSSLDLTMSSL